jgi:hypothetical protein
VTLLTRLDALESKVSKTRHNSSFSPSSDGLAKETRALREASGRQPGGQLFHGFTENFRQNIVHICQVAH